MAWPLRNCCSVSFPRGRAMLNPVKMSWLDAVVLKKDARAALRSFGAAGALELEKPLGPAVRRQERTGPLKDCGDKLARLAALRGALGAASPVATGAMSFDEAGAALADWEGKAEGPLRLRGELEAGLKALAAEAEKLLPYAGLPLPSAGEDCRFLFRAAGEVPAENFRALEAGLPAGAALLPLGEKDGRRHIAALGARPAEKLSAALKSAGFQPAVLPSRPGFTLAELAEDRAERERSARVELRKAEAGISALAEAAAGPLAEAERALLTEKRLLEAEEGLGSTGAAVLISGWTPAAAVREEAGSLNEISGGLFAVEAKPPGGGEVPVLLRPPRLFRPFVPLVTAFGLPRYGEVEPTVFAAPLFLALFGMMFGDAGQGAVVCLGGLWLGLKGRPAAREAGKAVFACGLSAVFFGLLYGSFFGMERFREYALWRDPLAGDPLLLLKAALAAGIAVISLGLALNAANRLRAGDLAGALLGRFGFAGLVFYWCGVALAAGLAGPRLLLPLMGLAAACWIVREPALYLLGRGASPEKGKDGFFAVAAGALVGAFEGALLYLANTVSFVRLAAYAMCHAALLAAAWALRDAADKAWGQNSAAGLLAVLAGNAAAIGLEGLVAAVQALRLEYYEFFGKFFEGGGRPFRPFTLEIKGEI